MTRCPNPKAHAPHMYTRRDPVYPTQFITDNCDGHPTGKCSRCGADDHVARECPTDVFDEE